MLEYELNKAKREIIPSKVFKSSLWQREGKSKNISISIVGVHAKGTVE